MASEALEQELQSSIVTILGYKPSELLNRSDWGELNFSDCEQDLLAIQQMLRPITNLPLRLVPDSDAKQFKSVLTNLITAVQNLDNFTITVGNAVQARDQLASRITANTAGIYGHASRHAAYLSLQSGGLTEVVADMQAKRLELTNLISDTTKFVTKSRKDISETMATAREIAGTAGVGHFSTDFEEEAGDRKSDADGWLKVVLAFGALTTIVSVALFFVPLPENPTPALILQLTLSKVFLLATLVGGNVWSARQYRALKHQVVINRHRANALNTFQAFVQAASNEQAKDAVLMETTRSIFAIMPSGFLGSQENPTQDAMKIVEMVKGVGGNS